MTGVDPDALRKLNAFVAETNVKDFGLRWIQAGSLYVVGSEDLSYYHQVELVFEDFAHVNLPREFSSPRLRLASAHEALAPAHLRSDPELSTFVFETPDAPGGVFFVCACRLRIEYGMAYHYRRTPLQPGERIAPWVDQAG
ncbi:hypothetical protein HPC49_33200 [Pyxidicoccus fallax]|uniref:Uncharacterized protein n=1 Tax=Pyxidicoccus fallax TaxID=394095 RepID=A0A848LLJ4_9BACT|nr:hypothetical protein [Pyxidicoccus fallax]NMO18569.1 hypothetical protein [Pyxidicoccus fallax]NPC83066.1 hypothetical protein [Pyxidicoccus fallax]